MFSDRMCMNGSRALHPAPCTLHPAPCILHPAHGGPGHKLNGSRPLTRGYSAQQVGPNIRVQAHLQLERDISTTTVFYYFLVSFLKV